MALPGFTAENSLGPPSQHYRITTYSGLAAEDSFVPQQLDAVDEAAEVGEGEIEDDTDMPETEASGDDTTNEDEA